MGARPRFSLFHLIVYQAGAMDSNALTARAYALLDEGRPEAALAAFDAARAAGRPGFAVHQGRARVLALLKRNQEALESFEAALSCDPASLEALDGVALTALHLCDWERVARIAPELERRIARGEDISPWTFLGYSGDARLQKRCAETDIRLRLPPYPPLWRGERYSHARIRLAYISSDFRDHAVASQIAELIERHDRSRFEVIAIATTPDDGSVLRARLVRAFDRFEEAAGLDHFALAARLRAMEIDVLVDLNGHTQGENFGVLAQRPARVQLMWLGYPGTAGAPFLDGVIADAVVAPDPGEFSEPVRRLPGCFFVSDTTRPIAPAPTRAGAGLPDGATVFCSFNNNWKITAPVFACWMRILAQVEGSVLWLRQSGGGADANLRRAAARHGVDPARLVFAPRLELAEHLARHACADLFLDTAPYNAHSTACDALWAGLPVLTCRGTAFAGRVAASLLTAVGLPELITETSEDYEALALALARDPARLAALGVRLAAGRATAPLFDTVRFARELEALFVSLL